MPYGVKKDVDGTEIDFDAVYKHIIKEAVEAVGGVECERCDDVDAPGWVHDRMVRAIASAEVAVVDTSSLNANVFYELGVRHALRRAATVLIHKEGTTFPFNIAGLNSIEYNTDLTAAAEAKAMITTFIRNALANPDAVDSLVYNVLHDLHVTYGVARRPQPVLKNMAVRYSVAAKSEKYVGMVTGDREALEIGDVWVSSENTNMQLDRFYGMSTSATIRYLGAEKHPVTNSVIADTIADEVAALMGAEKEVAPATVLVTGSGSLEATNGVRRIFHVAAVDGQPREGYRPVERIDRCVTNALTKAGSADLADLELRSIVFPVFGTGPGGADFKKQATRLVDAAISYLEDHETPIESVYFYVWSDIQVEELTALLAGHHRLGERAATMEDM